MKITMLIDGQEVKLTAEEMKKVIEANQVLESALAKSITQPVKQMALNKPKSSQKRRVKFCDVNSQELTSDIPTLLDKNKTYEYLLDSDLVYKSADTGEVVLTDSHTQVIQRKIIIRFFLERLNEPAKSSQVNNYVRGVDPTQLKASISSQFSFMRKLGILSYFDGVLFLSSKFVDQ